MMGKKNPEAFTENFFVGSPLDENGQPKPNELIEKLSRHYLDSMPMTRLNKQALVMVILHEQDCSRGIKGIVITRWMTLAKFKTWANRKTTGSGIKEKANKCYREFTKNSFVAEHWGTERHILFWIMQRPENKWLSEGRMVQRPLGRKG